MGTNTSKAVTLRKGQAVSWHESPSGLAQVDDLCRKNVVLGWYQRGQWRLRRVAAGRVAEAMKQGLLVNVDSPHGRAFWPREKTFNV